MVRKTKIHNDDVVLIDQIKWLKLHIPSKFGPWTLLLSAHPFKGPERGADCKGGQGEAAKRRGGPGHGWGAAEERWREATPGRKGGAGESQSWTGGEPTPPETSMQTRVDKWKWVSAKVLTSNLNFEMLKVYSWFSSLFCHFVHSFYQKMLFKKNLIYAALLTVWKLPCLRVCCGLFWPAFKTCYDE